ncbi:unnamed protein product [Owenia fusiformis]|uniref:Uncharacterized protein n=1 Tax=Owenia fusiformis TaxID=6347 RepID=A0A8J1XR96_OWEFU|nr:unnamed protein product [Owenia fusiformis]
MRGCSIAIVALVLVGTRDSYTVGIKVGNGGPMNTVRDALLIDTDAPKDAKPTCEVLSSFYTVASKDMPSSACLPLVVLTQIECKHTMRSCSQCAVDKDASIPVCIQTYGNHWVPLFCTGGIRWTFVRVPSGCSCYKDVNKKK